MDEFTFIDAVVGMVIFVSAILAYSRGLVREVLSIAGWVIAAFVAFILAPQAEPLVREIPYISDFIGPSCQLGIITAFAGIFAITLILTSIFTPIFSGLVQSSIIGGMDQGLGFLFGVLRGLVLVLIGLIIYDYIGVTEDSVENSRTQKLLTSSKEKIQTMIPTERPQWIIDRYDELIGTCSASDNTLPTIGTSDNALPTTGTSDNTAPTTDTSDNAAPTTGTTAN